MWADGICRTANNHYTKTVQYQDINYQLSQNEDKTAIFEGWSDFLNYFDSSVDFQLSFLNLTAFADSAESTISIPLVGDEFDSIRMEYTDMLRGQLSRGNNGIVKSKFLTFGIDAKNVREAKPRLERIELDILSNFKKLGVKAAALNGKERLRIMHSIFRMGTMQPFNFDWRWLVPTGLSPKDFIAPSAFEFKTGNCFRMGDTYGQASFLQIEAPELNDRILADFLDIESNILVTLHIHSIDQTKAIKTIKRKITDLDKSKIEEQKKAVRSGYDMDIIPTDLATYGDDAKKLLQDLQSHNERYFLMTPIIVNVAESMQQLKNNVFQTSSIAQKHNCSLMRLDYQQEEGLMSSLPLGVNQIEIQRGLTTSSTAIFVPFTTQELFQTGKEALYYGVNALSNNIIMVDRKKLKNPNGLILGVPGSGKSFSAKREITNVFLSCPDDDIIICDPEGEYTTLVNRLRGQVIRISPTGLGYDGKPCYINPMDLNMDYSDDENPLSLKSDFILSLCELIVGGKDGLAPVEKTVIDRCVRIVYRKYLNDLNNLCRSFGNFSVETMYKRYPIAKRSHRKRLPVLTQEQMEFIAEKGLAVPDSDRRMIRAYGVVGIYLGGGTRTIEVQHAKACNVFLTGEATPYIYLDFVKGQDTYGEERPAALIPMFIPLVERYMALRETLLEEGDAESEHYVFCLDSFDMMSDKTIRLIRKIVEEDTGIRFDGRMCRRTYAQYWKDQGVPIEAVSRNLGHASTKTTETFYGRIRQMDAVDLMKVKDSKN